MKRIGWYNVTSGYGTMYADPVDATFEAIIKPAITDTDVIAPVEQKPLSIIFERKTLPVIPESYNPMEGVSSLIPVNVVSNDGSIGVGYKQTGVENAEVVSNEEQVIIEQKKATNGKTSLYIAGAIAVFGLLVLILKK